MDIISLLPILQREAQKAKYCTSPVFECLWECLNNRYDFLSLLGNDHSDENILTATKKCFDGQYFGYISDWKEVPSLDGVWTYVCSAAPIIEIKQYRKGLGKPPTYAKFFSGRSMLVLIKSMYLL